MLDKLKKLFSGISEKEEIKNEDLNEALQFASSALLIETALADKNFDELEINSLKETLKTVFSIDNKTIEIIIEDAQETVDESTSLYEHTRIINDSCTYEDKKKLLNCLWAIAFADGKVDKYEEHLIRKISGLLHISHSDFISEKLKITKS